MVIFNSAGSRFGHFCVGRQPGRIVLPVLGLLIDYYSPGQSRVPLLALTHSHVFHAANLGVRSVRSLSGPQSRSVRSVPGVQREETEIAAVA